MAASCVYMQMGRCICKSHHKDSRPTLTYGTRETSVQKDHGNKRLW